MADDVFDMRGKVVVVTGGQGMLGRGFCSALVARGARVASFDVTQNAATAASDSLMVVRADVTDRRSLENALAQVRSKWGVPDGLVNCAALDSPPDAPATQNGPVETYPGDVWDKVMEVNVKGVFQACQVIGGAMHEAKRGAIVNIASIYGIVSPDQRLYEHRRARGEAFFKPAAYSASKSALLNLTRHLATYWAPEGPRVNTLSLGGVFSNQDAQFLERYEYRTPLGRMARAGEYEGALVFLLSAASSYMTGANLVVDGGWTAW